MVAPVCSAPDVVAALLAPLRARPAAAAVAIDFDGTLAPIVAEAAAARPLDGVAAALEVLAARYGVVAVLSGRPVAFLEPLVPRDVTLSGLYGLEGRVDGEVVDHPEADRWRPVVAQVADIADAAADAADADAAADAADLDPADALPAGVHVERKGLSLTLHYRAVPTTAVVVEAWAARQAHLTGLVARSAKMSVELHPPIAADKGTALLALVAGLVAVCYLGDDLGDLPAFAALDGLAAEGVAVARIAVAGPEAPPEVLAAADVVVDGPAGVLAVLELLGR